MDDLAAVAAEPGLVFGGDGRGGFVVPEMGPHVDGMAAFVRLLGLVARTQLTLSAIDARIPRTALLRARVATPWARKGQVMRAVLDAAGDRAVDTTDGVRVVEADAPVGAGCCPTRARRSPGCGPRHPTRPPPEQLLERVGGGRPGGDR